MGKPEPRLRPITRLVPEKLVSFDCVVCGKHVEQMRLPGPKPKYCSDRCRKDAEALRKRQLRSVTGKNHGKRGRPKKIGSPDLDSTPDQSNNTANLMHPIE